MKFKDIKINQIFLFPDGKFIWKKTKEEFALSDVELVERYVYPDEEIVIEGNVECKLKLKKN